MEVHDERVPEEQFAEFLATMPQVCVEVMVSRGDAALVARRTAEPAAGEYFWPGGRLYKGEPLDDAARRVAREELGIDVELLDRLGVYEHFWDVSSVEGVDSRHTVNVVYRVRPVEADPGIELDGQHDDYRWVDAVEPWMHEHVRRYLVDAGYPA
jgi:colanic acid biosynthesis protein WcaH